MSMILRRLTKKTTAPEPVTDNQEERKIEDHVPDIAGGDEMQGESHSAANTEEVHVSSEDYKVDDATKATPSHVPDEFSHSRLV